MPARPPTSKFQTVSLTISARSYSSSQDPTGALVDRTNTATDDPAPSLGSHYRNLVTTTSRSASAPRNGTHTRLNFWLLPVADETSSQRTDFATECRDTPSHVSCKSRRPDSCRLRAGHRLASNRGTHQALLTQSATRLRFRCHSYANDTSTAVRGYSSSWSPPDTSNDAFSTSLTTTVFSQRSMWWFEAPARPATPKGHPSSLAEHRFPKSLSYLHQDLRFSFVAHVAGVFDPAHHQAGGDRIGGGRKGGVDDFGDVGIRDPLTGVGIDDRAGIAHRCPGVGVDGGDRPLDRSVAGHHQREARAMSDTRGHHRAVAVSRIAPDQNLGAGSGGAGGADRLGDHAPGALARVGPPGA